MRAQGKEFLFVVVVICFILGSPLLSASSGSAWAVYADPPTYSVSGYLNPVSDLSSVYFVGMYTNGDSNFYFAQNLGSTFAANQSTPFTFDISYYGAAPEAYTILAIHASELFDGVTVGSNNIPTGTSWDSLFGTQYTQGTFNSLLVGSYINLYLEEFYANNAYILGAPMGKDLTLVNFSAASPGGSAHATASSVPLPASLLLFGPGLAGLAVLRRRFKK